MQAQPHLAEVSRISSFGGGAVRICRDAVHVVLLLVITMPCVLMPNAEC